MNGIRIAVTMNADEPRKVQVHAAYQEIVGCHLIEEPRACLGSLPAIGIERERDLRPWNLNFRPVGNAPLRMQRRGLCTQPLQKPDRIIRDDGIDMRISHLLPAFFCVHRIGSDLHPCRVSRRNLLRRH